MNKNMKKGLGITKVWQNKPKSFQEYIAYRNELLLKRDQRILTFGDLCLNYYHYRLIEIDSQYPEFKGLGKIILKK